MLKCGGNIILVSLDVERQTNPGPSFPHVIGALAIESPLGTSDSQQEVWVTAVIEIHRSFKASFALKPNVISVCMRTPPPAVISRSVLLAMMEIPPVCWPLQTVSREVRMDKIFY